MALAQWSRGKPFHRGPWRRHEDAILIDLYGTCADEMLVRRVGRSLRSIQKRVDFLFPTVPSGFGKYLEARWTETQDEILRLCLGNLPDHMLARRLQVSKKVLAVKLAEWKRSSRSRPWTLDEDVFFRQLYCSRPDEALALVFQRPLGDIIDRARQRALRKDKGFLCRLHGRHHVSRMPRWKPSEEAKLRQWHPDLPDLEIARRLNRSVASIRSRAERLGLKKSAARLEKMGRANIALRYAPRR